MNVVACGARPVRTLCAALFLFQLSLPLASQNAPAAPYTRDTVLVDLDRAAPNIKSFSADVEDTDYVKLADDTTIKRGTLNFEKSKSGPLYALDLTEVPPNGAAHGRGSPPGRQILIYKDTWGWMAQPNTKEAQKKDLSQHRDMLDKVMLLGLGESGKELADSFDVSAPVAENLDSVSTVHVTLTPRDPGMLRTVTRIDLWYDTAQWVAVQVKIWHPNGDFSQLHYTKTKVNPHIDDSRFDTKFPGYTITTAN